MALNRAEIIGNLGSDPDVRSFSNGGKVANLSIATTRKWRDRQSGETREETEWHRVAITAEGLAGVAERYLKKGSKVFIAGRLRTRKWQDQNGQDRYSTEIVVSGFEGTLEMLGGPRSGEGDQSGGGYGSQQGGGYGGGSSGTHGGTGGGSSNPIDDDEIPF
nr:single-stranded DNA-binding protein [Tritonibacter litoralis]